MEHASKEAAVKRIMFICLVVTMLFGLPGCGEQKEVKIALAISDRQRVASPQVATSDVTDLVEGNSVFSFDLYQALGEKRGNLFYSPYSNP